MIANVILFYSVAVMNIIIGSMRKKNQLLVWIAFVLIFILMTYNFKGPDIGNYINGYINSLDGDAGFTEIGYKFLMRIANTLNLNFFSFRAIISVVCLILFHSTIKFYKSNENIIIGLYMILLFFMDTIQMRNFVVAIIVLFSTKYLIDKSNFSALKYILCIIVATIFHSIAPIYLLLLVCKYIRNRKVFYAMLVFSICSFIFFFISRGTLNSMLMFITKLLGVKTEYSGSATRYGFIPVFLVYIFSMIMMHIYISRINKNTKKYEILNTIWNIYVVMSLLLPLLLINTNFYRIFRNISLLGLLFFGISSNEYEEQQVRVIPMYIITVGWWIIEVVLYNNIKTIILPIFSGNLVFDLKNFPVIFQSIIIVSVILSIFLVLQKTINSRKKVSLLNDW